jgi:nitroimidazol reductase NimA-like FMN-containing flavoprotein (pyridoxamine 5'-phosphate oxidase superfamily)
MPGYGTLGPDEGTGLLAWSWAEERLLASHDYWLATVWPDGRPHVMPVWGVWREAALWVSSSRRSRKARNLAAEPRCTVATDNALEPVVLDGSADLVTDLAVLRAVLDDMNAKYQTDYTMELMDPGANACFRITPSSAFGLLEGDFTGSPTLWVFGGTA